MINKYRLWDSNNKIMNYTPHLSIVSGIVEVNYDFEILMRYAGFKDKNGIHVYESDIISNAGAFVIWDEKLLCWAFNFKNDKEGSTPLFYDDNIERSEIFGNIYENPELLK